MTEPYRSLSLVGGGGTCDGCSKLCYAPKKSSLGEEIGTLTLSTDLTFRMAVIYCCYCRSIE